MNRREVAKAKSTLPTELADTTCRTAEPLLRREATGVRYRLIGVGVADLGAASAPMESGLFEPAA